jgi:SPP1 family phage portal protein
MSDKALIDTTRISDLINSDLATEHKKKMEEGTDYYNTRHDILDHLNYYYEDGDQPVVDKISVNNIIPHPFHKILVDQKAAYIAGNPIVIGVDDETFQEDLILHLTEDFDDIVNDWIKGASNKGVEWLHFYIDPKGELEYIICPAEQIIPVYDTQYQNELIYVIRFYIYDLISPSGQSQQRYKVEFWDKDEVEYFAQTESSNFIHDPDYEVNPAPHWFTFNTMNPEVKTNNSWGRVPFVGLYNNSEMYSDLHPIKDLIDAYDKVKSGWCNDLEDFAEQILVLKGFTGLRGNAEIEAGISQLALFIKNLKRHKVVAIEGGSESSVEPLKNEIPVEAKEKFLTLTRKEIFYFGEGVDVSDEKIGNSPSGIALKFLYSSLDLKANRLIRKLKSALKGAIWFVVEYLNLTENTKYDYEQVTFTINKSMIFNEAEKIDSLVKSKDILSEQTILENHPYVEDVQGEMDRLKVEREEKQRKQIELIKNRPAVAPPITSKDTRVDESQTPGGD